MLYQLSYASPSHPETAPETLKNVRAHHHFARTTAQKSRLAHRRERSKPGWTPEAVQALHSRSLFECSAPFFARSLLIFIRDSRISFSLQDKFSLFRMSSPCFTPQPALPGTGGARGMLFLAFHLKFRLFPAKILNFVRKSSFIAVQMYFLSGRMCLQCRSLLIFVL